MNGKRYLPFVLLGLWFLTYQLLTSGKRWFPRIAGTMWFQWTGLILGALLLSAAILICLQRLSSRKGGPPEVVASVLAGLLFIGQTCELLYLSAAETDIVFGSEPETLQHLEKLGHGALAGKNPKGRRLDAEWAFVWTGLTIPYVPESGPTQLFEPTAAEMSKRDQQRMHDREERQTLSVIRAQAQQLRWAADEYLAVAALVLGPGMFWIGARHPTSRPLVETPSERSFAS